jgi:CspA family cold shock protein
VKWYSRERGFGFAACDDGTDVFVGINTLRRCGIEALAWGDRIEFETKPGRGTSLEAVGIVLVERAERPEGPRPQQHRRDGLWTLPGEDEV